MLDLSHIWVFVLAPTLLSVHPYPTKANEENTSSLSGIGLIGKRLSVRAAQRLEEVQQENELQAPPSSRRSPGVPPVGRNPLSSRRSLGVLPLPVPQEDVAEPEFMLDLRNYPELANADGGRQNPNIQVSIEVVDDTQSEMEMEMDLAEEGQRSDWSPASTQWASGHRKLFWPLFWEYPDQAEEDVLGQGNPVKEEEEEHYVYDPEEPGPSSGGRGKEDGQWDNAWDAKESYEHEADWGPWGACSVSCGHGAQKRLRSCGYACMATETRTCELEACSGDVAIATEVAPTQKTIAMDSLDDTTVDSCEKWLSCKSDFLQSYLRQVRAQLPSCPCSYPSEAVYSAVGVADARLHRTFRWRDASGPRERLDIYKPSARLCLRSLLAYDSATLAAQHCCYDDRMALITRGPGAAAPNLISAEFSAELHRKVDVLPWILCRGDWSRFHAARPPDNGLACPNNPPDDVYLRELREAGEY